MLLHPRTPAGHECGCIAQPRSPTAMPTHLLLLSCHRRGSRRLRLCCLSLPQDGLQLRARLARCGLQVCCPLPVSLRLLLRNFTPARGMDGGEYGPQCV